MLRICRIRIAMTRVAVAATMVGELDSRVAMLSRSGARRDSICAAREVRYRRMVWSWLEGLRRCVWRVRRVSGGRRSAWFRVVVS
jgi:hypothetical protein